MTAEHVRFPFHMQALRRSVGLDADILSCLARTYHHWREGDRDHLPESTRACLRSLHASPHDSALRFNVAFSLQEYGLRCHSKLETAVKGKERSATLPDTAVNMLGGAKKNMELAAGLFAQLKVMGGLHGTGVEERRLDAHIKFCGEMVLNMSRWLGSAALYDSAAAEARQAAARASQAEENKRREIEAVAAAR